MADVAEKQFNNRFSVVPSAFFGKDGSSRFQSGGKRLTASTILTGSLLNTRENVLGTCKTSYADIINELGYARATTARNVANLTDSGIFNRSGQSQYMSSCSLDIKHGLPVYHFLRLETFNRVRLTGNDVLTLSNLIRFYLNEKREQKYFIGGEQRVASFLNVAESTAHDVINRLLKSGTVQRFMLHDGKLSGGKGINGDYQTVYVVNKDILKRVKDIRREINKQKVQQETLRKIFSTRPESVTVDRDKPRKHNLLDEYQSNVNRAAEVKQRFKNDVIFNRFKSDYISLRDKYITALRRNYGQDSAETDEVQAKIDSILSDVLNYLQTHNLPKTYIPNNWKSFIREILNP